MEKVYCKEFTEKLDTDKRSILVGLISQYKNATELALKDWTLLASRIRADPEILKAFVFSVMVVPTSIIHQDTFLLLKDERLECYFRRFIRGWEDNGKRSWNNRLYSLPPNLISFLKSNDKLNFPYHIILLNNPHIRLEDKNFLIEFWAKFYHKEDNYLDENQVNVYLKLKNKFDIDLSPIFPSIRQRFNLEDVPDEWIKESFL
jgi:hypothetical protein